MANGVDFTSKISIWWDIEKCHVPNDVDPHFIAQNLGSALREVDLGGPIEINVFGDTNDLDSGTQKALCHTGITLNHVPRGNKDAADKVILVAMLLWALDNPPPAHFLLISGDGDFANALHRLRLKQYSILLARPDQFVKPALLRAAKRVWYWKNLAKGQLEESEMCQPTERLHESPFLQNARSNDSATLAQGSQQKSGSIHSAGVAIHITPATVSTGFSSPQKIGLALQGKDASDATTVSATSESQHFTSFSSQFQNLHMHSEEAIMEVNRVGNGSNSRSQSSAESLYNGKHRGNSDYSVSNVRNTNSAIHSESARAQPKFYDNISSSNSNAVVSSCFSQNTVSHVTRMDSGHHPRSLPEDKLHNECRQHIMPHASLSNTIGLRWSSTLVQYAPPSIVPLNSAEAQYPAPKVPFQYVPPNTAGAQSPVPNTPVPYAPPNIAEARSSLPKVPAPYVPPGIAEVQSAVSKMPVHYAPPNIVESQSPVYRYEQREAVPRNLAVTSSPHLSQSNSVRNLQISSHDSGLDRVYSAMKTLEQEMLAPTLSNLLDCIQYWDQQDGNFDLNQILSKAVELRQVTKTQLGLGLIMYFPPNNKPPWKCVDPGNMQNEYPHDVWGELQHFLLNDGQRLAFFRSRSRYEAAQILKKVESAHMSKLVIGKLLNLLQQAIQEKKWLMRTVAGWSVLPGNVLEYSRTDIKRTELGPSSHPGHAVTK